MEKFDSYIVDSFILPYKKKAKDQKISRFCNFYFKTLRGIFYIFCPNRKSTDRLVSFLVRRG